MCLRELNRLLALEQVRGPAGSRRLPVLDVGCGDGFWWTLQDVDRSQVYGIDLKASELVAASRRIRTERADISRQRPFPGTSFAEIIGNCSLEHVRDINHGLRNMRDCAAPGARLVLFVPARDWGYQGLTQGFLLRHAPRLAMTLSGALNGFFQHWHLYDVGVWTSILESNGWRVETVSGLGNQRSEFLFRLMLPSSFFAFLVKSVIGAYPNRLLRWLPDAMLRPASRLMAWALQDQILVAADSPKCYEYLFLARVEAE